ncbi:hypothetical protein B0H34DRAFT_722916 [Crassisporium funariophilum]|nr:hypothetical protein B0H34DRAFT_722916 [Crassisporium funariophilum]
MIISTKKYACETCIKGHRSSACKHTDRPLFEIKKKGRPVTQCEHCRELRKTKQVHVKCICETKAESLSNQQGPKAGLDSAAFPNGLPEALGASVAFQANGDGTSSDSDHGGVCTAHRCKSGDPCPCITQRIRDRKAVAIENGQRNAAPGSSRGHLSSPNSSHTSSQILARIAQLRPVLPRPSADGFNIGGPVHNPSMGVAHGHGSRHHDNVFKPYERAYGMTHQQPVHPQSYPTSPGPSNPAFSFNEQSFNDQMQMMGVAPRPVWDPRQENLGMIDISTFPSMCGCGDDCSCPGCLQHNRSTTVPSSSAYGSCTNPGACSNCLDCTILSLPASTIIPPDTALSIYDSQNDAIDEWLRQMSASVPPGSPTQHLESFVSNVPNFQQQQHTQAWVNRGFPFSGQQSSMQPQGFNYDGPNVPDMMTFATSGERCAGFPAQRQRGHRSQSSIPSMDDRSVIDPRLLPPNGMMGQSSQYLAVVTDPSRSRSPSTSSQSSNQGSDHHGSGPVPPCRPSGRMQGMFTSVEGVRSSPQLNVRPVMARGPNSASSSASPSPGSSSSSRPPYSLSNPETGGNHRDQARSQYPPNLAGLQIF